MATYLPQVQDTNALTGQTQNVNSNTTGSQISNTQQQGTQNGQAAQQNTYQPFQQALQGETAQSLGKYIQSGDLPSDWSMPSVLSQAYNQNFNQSVAPGLAAQYGAGSPAIASAQAQGLVNLEAQSYQNQQQNYQSALGQAGNIAFTPTGTTAQNQSANQGTSKTNSNWQQNMDQALDMLSNSNYMGISQVP